MERRRSNRRRRDYDRHDRSWRVDDVQDNCPEMVFFFFFFFWFLSKVRGDKFCWALGTCGGDVTLASANDTTSSSLLLDLCILYRIYG